MRNTLRTPRSPTPNASYVELNNLAPSQRPSQTSSELRHPSSELHQSKEPQKLNPYVPFAVKNGWFFAKIALRSLSFIFALVAFSIQLSFFIPVHDFGNVISVVIIFFFSASIIIWDSSEFITLCARRGFGINPKAHIGLDLVLCLGAMAGTAACFFEFDFIDVFGYNNLWGEDIDSKIYCSIAMFGCLIVIHFILFVRACVDKKRGIGATPKIMYLPTGEAVVVVPRPVPPMPTRQMTKDSTSPTRSQSPTDQTPSSTALPPPLPPLSQPLPPLPHDPQYSQTSTPISEAPTLMTPVPPPPRRKPLPVRGRHYASPWDAPGPEYQPSAEEIARAERGERQAQYMALDGIDTARVTRMDGPREKFLAGEPKKIERRMST